MSVPEILSGTLGAVGLPSLLQLLEGEGLTGRLRVEGAGELRLVDGVPVGGECEGHEGRLAALELFTIDARTFSFETAPVATAAPLGAMIELIMEGCRLADEWARLARCPVVRGPKGAEGVLGRLLAGCAAGVPLERARRRTGLARVACVDPVLTAVENGDLDLGAAQELPVDLLAPQQAAPTALRSAPAAPPVDYYEAVETGRERLRARDFDAAEQAFLQALSVRPDDRVARQNLTRVRQLRDEQAASRTATETRSTS